MARLIIHPERKHQTFDRFGVSGAWWAQVVGGWNETDEKSGLPKNERIAQLLFDKEKGIGVRCYRYNVGAGSAGSPLDNIPNECRRTESFDISNTEYDWSKDANAVNMMKLAVKYGADEVIFFVNSPIVRITKNHKSHLDRSFTTNLDKRDYSRFVKYCLDCTEHFIEEGVPVKYLSPVNEPVWKWTGGQEGCHYRPLQVWNLFRLFCDEMDKRPSLKDLKLSGAENGDIRFFNKTYCRLLLGDMKIRKRMDAIDVHSYFLCPKYTILEKTAGNRPLFLKSFRRYMDRHFPDVPVKTSEWTHMRGGRDYGIRSALVQTRVIIEDLTLLDVTSWQHWIALSNVDFCDGLIYEFDSPRAFRMTKRYYAFGNFTKFIDPGSVRIEASADDGLLTAAFINGDKYVVVISNEFKQDKQIEIPFTNAEIYVTSDDYDLAPQMFSEEITLPARSVTTIVAGTASFKKTKLIKEVNTGE